jgi:uncharacterized protein
MPAEVLSVAPSATLTDKVRFLSVPDSYPQRPASVEVQETHLSYVFLTPTDVYKLKKPVAHAYGDLRTLEARHANCRAEIQLNRRLALDVYFRVIPLTQSSSGTLALGGDGEIVEWLVHMVRLPAARMLDRLVQYDLLSPADVLAVGERLGEFFAAQPAVDIGIDRHIGQLRRQLEISAHVLAYPQFALRPSDLARIHTALIHFLDGTELAARVRHRRIVEGHGDLRPEHICVLTPPVIIDCLEFSRELRLLDPFDEIAFLSLECARLGAPWVGALLQSSVETRLNDHPTPRLIAFYTALRACVRAHLAVAHLLEPAPRTPSKWIPLARTYLACAERACVTLK